MGIFSGIGDALGGVMDVVSKVGDVAGGIKDMLGGIMDSPLGGLLATVFPPAGMAMGALNLADMLGDVAGTVGGEEMY